LTELPDYEPNPQWVSNSGKSGIIFNSENSYNQNIENKEIRLQIREQAKLAKEYLPYSRTIQTGKNKVLIFVLFESTNIRN
jgi:hypothetical protein